jgi:hypothetical protein
VEVRVVRADHMQLVDPTGDPWHLVRDWLRRRVDGTDNRSTLDP